MDGNNLMIVMEYVEGNDLCKILYEPNKCIKPFCRLEKYHEQLQVLYEIAFGLSYLHALGVVHRDIKSANIMVTHDNHVKLVDFGIGRLTPPGHSITMTSGIGTPLWMSPEVMIAARYDTSCDCYSFALVAYEIVAKRLPYPPSLTFEQLKQFVVHERRRPSIDSNCPDMIKDVLSKCWSHITTERYTMAQVASKLYEEISQLKNNKRDLDRVIKQSQEEYTYRNQEEDEMEIAKALSLSEYTQTNSRRSEVDKMRQQEEERTYAQVKKQIEELQRMGFKSELAQMALALNNFDLDKAVEYCLSK